MRRLARLVALLIGLTLLAGSARAHHSQAGIFDSTRTIEVTGVITSVSWRNPHGQILLSVKDNTGKEAVWDAETASISILRNRGADGSSIRVGDRVTIAGAPSLRNRPEILARSVLLPSGYEFTFGSANAYFPAGKAGRVIGSDDTFPHAVPSRRELLVGLVLALGILAVIVALKATPPPWAHWFR